ncbi:MAG: DUF6114 domain-containing protein [Planifilum fimeticola]|jgi:hypothetical protein
MEKIAEQRLSHEPPGEGGSPVPTGRSAPKRRPKAGLILVILAGLIILWIPVNLYWLAFVPGSFAFTGLLFGTMVLLCGILGWIMPQYVRLLGVFAMVLSIISIMGALGGLLIGTVLGVVGGSLCAAWDPDGKRSRGRSGKAGVRRRWMRTRKEKKSEWPTVAKAENEGGAD